MKKYIIATLLILPFTASAFSFGNLFGATVFNPFQLAPSPSNGDCLTTNGTINIWGDCGTGSSDSGSISTSSVPTIGQVPMWTGWNTLGSVPTTTASCSGDASCSPFVIFGDTPIDITATAGVSSIDGTLVPNTIVTAVDSNTLTSTSSNPLWVTRIQATSTSATSTLPMLETTTLKVATALEIAGEYITNFTNYVRGLFTGGTGITLSSGDISFDCSEVEGTGINCVGEAVTLDTTGLVLTTGIDTIAELNAILTGEDVASTTATLLGDVTGNLGATVVGDNSHEHDSTTISGLDISADTNLTAGDALTLTGDDIDFDGGASPAGDLGGTWASPSVDDDSHAHTATTISGLGVSDFSSANISQWTNDVGFTTFAYPFPSAATSTRLTFSGGIDFTYSSSTIYSSFIISSSTQGYFGSLSLNGTDLQTTLNSKDSVTTAGDGLTRTVNDFDCDTASGSTFGCLSAANWTTFNNKVSYTDAAVNAYIQASTTIPKTYTENTFTSKQTFSQASTTQLTVTGTGTSTVLMGNVVIGGNLLVEGDFETEGALWATIIASIVAVIASATITFTNKTISGKLTLAENASIALDPAGSDDGKYSGITITGLAGATVAFGDLITLDKDDSRWELVDISVAAAATGDARGVLGMAVSAGNDGDTITILLDGIIRADTNFPTLTIGAAVYASTTGDIVVAQPSTADYVIRIIGSALTANEMFFRPDFSWITHT